MTSELESLTLGSLALNDQTTYAIEGDSFSFKPAEPLPQFVNNPDTSGETLVQEPAFSNAYMEFTVRVLPQSTDAIAFEKLGKLTNALQDCARLEGGQALEWLPHNIETTYTAYVLVGEYEEIPITVTGESAGYFLKSPVVKVKLTLRPFLYRPERTAKAATESGAEPLQTLYVKEIKGDVPAEARLVITDKASKDRRYLEWGRDVVKSESNPALLITAASLVTTSFSGEAKTRSGAYSEEKVKRATAVSQPTTMCGTGVIEHKGSFRILGRVYAASTAARYRISYRNGEGPLVPLEWQEPPVIENFSQIDFGEIALDEALIGTQKGEIRVEVKSSTGESIELDLNYLEFIPTVRGAGRARGTANNNPNKLLAYDTFLQTEGNLDTPKALPLGGNWAEASKTGAAGFKVIAAEDLARRTEVSDASLTAGCFAIAGSEEPTTSKASIRVKASAAPTTDLFQRGAFVRYGSTEKWLMAYYKLQVGGFPYIKLVVAKRVGAEAPTVLDEISLLSLGPAAQTTQLTVSISAGADGTWQAWCYPSSQATEPAPLLEGQDSVLATGGTLAKGKGGFYDAYTAGAALTRDYDNFSLLSGEEAGRVCYSGKKAEVRSSGFLRQDSTGTYYGPASIYRGAGMYLRPEGEAGWINRIAVAMRRNDVVAEADSAPEDKMTCEVLARERFLLPR